MKKILRGVLLGLVALLIVVPVLAYSYANITVTESLGNTYSELPVIVESDVQSLAAYHFITSTGLDTRVLTGDGTPLPHMLAEDRILFVTDLAGHETKSLIFYMGATSLDDFYIIPGYSGYITTPDDEDLELTYVIEILISGYFDASAGSNKNILYKQDAWRVWISAANTLKVAALSDGDAIVWDLQYSSFTTGTHTIYIVANGLAAFLYVDTFDTPKDTENLYSSSNMQIAASADNKLRSLLRRTFYSQGLYWAFIQAGSIYYTTSADGTSWESWTNVPLSGSDGMAGFGVCENGGNVHIAYGATQAGNDYVRYRMGALNTSGGITWADTWQTAVDFGDPSYIVGEASIVTDLDGYPYVVYGHTFSTTDRSSVIKSSVNNGTWTTASGYPFVFATTSPFGHSETLTNYFSSNKIYLLYSGGSNTLYGRYYNGVSWAGAGEEIAGDNLGAFTAVSDDDDNVYIVWQSASGVNLRIRYADGSFNSPALVDSGASEPSISYNNEHDHIYITYLKGGYVKAAVLAGGTLVSGYTLFTAGNNYLTSTAYGDHIGVLQSAGSGYTYHGYIEFPYEWNDTETDWIWMQNNVMPYADYMMMAIDGVTQLEYEPADIIEDSTLIDEVSDNDGIITWGDNPGGVTTSIGAFTSTTGQTVPVSPTTPTSPQDLMPDTGGQGITGGLGTLEGNPFYPIVSALSMLSGLIPGKDPIPIPLMWVILASIILIAITVVCVWKMPHQLITLIVMMGLTFLFNRMGIYPWWILIVVGAIGITIIYFERKPAL